VQIARQVRGMNPWPVAQTLYQDQALRIWQAEAIKRDTVLVPAVVSCSQKTMDVSTGNGFLRLQEVQLPGGKRMPIEAFLSAHNVHGITLG
jgi:methionyl-tRNA formyltransferase